MPLITVLAIILMNVMFGYFTEAQQKRQVRKAFSSYMAPALVDQLVGNPDRLSLNGESREMTFLFSDIAGFVREGARMHTGDTLAADLIVLATGYKGQEYLVRKLFGDDVAARVGPIWGFGDEQELRNMFTRTAQPGLWFIAGSLAQCRIYSKYLALQIKACEVGLLPRVRALPDTGCGRFSLGNGGIVWLETYLRILSYTRHWQGGPPDTNFILGFLLLARRWRVKASVRHQETSVRFSPQ
jgi:hypothetical protein